MRTKDHKLQVHEGQKGGLLGENRSSYNNQKIKNNNNIKLDPNF